MSAAYVSAKKMTPQERKEMERAAQKHKSKKKLWVAVNDKGSKTKRGKWAGNATFQWQGDDAKHAEEIPLRDGDVLKLQGKDLWVHPKKGEPFQYAGKKDEDEKAPEEKPEDQDAGDEGNAPAPEEEAPKQKPQPKKKPKPADDEGDDEEDNFDDEEGAGPLTPEEIAADEEAEAIAAEEEKLALRKQALKADKAARAAKRKADATRDALAQKGVGGKLKTRVEDEGVDPVAADLADKVMTLAEKQSLTSFVKSLLFLGMGIKSGGESVKQLGPALRAQLATKRKELENKDDVIDAEFTVIENLKALDNPKLLPSGPLAPADDSDIDSLQELQKKHGIGLADAKLMRERLVKKQKDQKAAEEAAAAARAAKAAKPPPLPKKKKKAADEDLPMAKDEDVIAAGVRRVQAALKKVKAAVEDKALTGAIRNLEPGQQVTFTVVRKRIYADSSSNPPERESKLVAVVVKKTDDGRVLIKAKNGRKGLLSIGKADGSVQIIFRDGKPMNYDVLEMQASAKVRAGREWPRHGMPSLDSLDQMPDEPQSMENDIKMMRQLARVKGNDLAGVNLRLLANALESGGLPKAVRLLKTMERSMDAEDFGTFAYLLPDSILKAY